MITDDGGSWHWSWASLQVPWSSESSVMNTAKQPISNRSSGKPSKTSKLVLPAQGRVDVSACGFYIVHCRLSGLHGPCRAALGDEIQLCPHGCSDACRVHLLSFYDPVPYR